MYADLPHAFACRANRERIVKVLCVHWVNCECGDVTEVLTLCYLFLGYVCRQLGSGLLDSLGVLVRQAIFGQDGVHLGIVLSALAKYVNDLAHGVLAVQWPFKELDNGFVAVLATLEQVLWNEYVVRHKAVLGNEESVVLLYVQFADECVMHTLYNLHHLAFASTASAAGEERHAYKVVGECVCRVALADEHRLTAVLGVELVVAVLVARECTEQH